MPSKGYAVGPRNYATALRSYAPNPSGPSSVQSGVTGSVAPHLSQPMPLDQDLVTAYKEAMTDPRAKQYEQTGMDIDRLWRTSPTASIFKPGYEHNPFIKSRADELRALRVAPAVSPEEELLRLADRSDSGD